MSHLLLFYLLPRMAVRFLVEAGTARCFRDQPVVDVVLHEQEREMARIVRTLLGSETKVTSHIYIIRTKTWKQAELVRQYGSETGCTGEAMIQ